MQVEVLAPMFSVAVLFIIIATQMWRRSISTAVHGVSVASAVYMYSISLELCIPIVILFTGVLINMLRAVFNTEIDHLIKRPCRRVLKKGGRTLEQWTISKIVSL